MWCQVSEPFLVFEPPHVKTNKMTVRPAKTQISLGIRPVWSESSLCAQWIAKETSFLNADSEDSGQTGRMPRLIWVFAGRTVILLVLSWGGSFHDVATKSVYFSFIVSWHCNHTRYEREDSLSNAVIKCLFILRFGTEGTIIFYQGIPWLLFC